MIEKVIHLHENIHRFDGYMVGFIETMYARVIAKSRFEITFSHNESVFIERAFWWVR